MVPEGWVEKALGEFVRLQRGHDLPEADRREGSVPVMGSAGPNGFHNEAKAKGPGVVIGRSGGSMGVVSYCETDYWPHNTVLYVTDFLGNHPRFVYYFLRHLDLRPFNSGSAQESLNRNYIYPVRVCVPEPAEQRAIAHILGALDDKIELNRRMAETLEATARALFKSWFVDFDPVRAKAGGRPTGLPDDIAGLFPSAFGDDGLPKGWENKPLKDLTTSIVRGVAPMYCDDGLIVINQKCIRGGHLDLSKARHHDSSQKPVSKDRDLAAGDILINSTGVGTLGRVAQIRRVDKPITADGHVTIIKLIPGQAFENVVGLRLLTAEAEVTELGEGSTGQTELPRAAVGAISVIVPPADVRGAFDAKVSSVRDRADAAVEQCNTLAELRDTLLPRLISGELRIRDAESAIEAA